MQARYQTRKVWLDRVKSAVTFKHEHDCRISLMKVVVTVDIRLWTHVVASTLSSEVPPEKAISVDGLAKQCPSSSIESIALTTTDVIEGISSERTLRQSSYLSSMKPVGGTSLASCGY
eukprot:CAMPEP_0182815482 /NCGR_PEP_ID=MMETSP0006_2-20121128/10412_1 /TAXON_ID=97485 /ORGANISM="Prymnesium parvum, Strain Texoma1" /LENGTH=117 /DNA_ID=CAMNT_0024941679 /DNA_START=562 /DNA_END=916 /DNA_ORIENTATION=+